MKRRARNSQRRRRNRLDFQTLEPRRLLAGDFMAPHQVAGELPSSTNLVVNGDFEDVVEGSDRFFDETEVASWEAFDAETGQQINIFDYNVDPIRSFIIWFNRSFWSKICFFECWSDFRNKYVC